jgi:hypothetical protein
MAEPKSFGDFDILETVNHGLMDFFHSLRPLLLIAAIPSILTVLYGALVSVDENTSQLALIAILLPANLISAPFYMALLYQLSRIRHSPATRPTDSLLAGVALLWPFVKTTLMVAALLIAAGLMLAPLVGLNPEGQVVIGPLGLVVVLALLVGLIAFSFYPQVILFDQRSGVLALGDSIKLFRAHWKRCLAVLAFPAMLSLMAQVLWSQASGIDTPQAATNAGPLLSFLAQLVSWLIIAMFESIRLVLFQDLRARNASTAT